MKRVHFLLAMLGLAVITGLTACGKKDDGGGSSSSSPNYAYQGTCQAGYVQTQYGCLPQGNCSVGSGFYQQQNQCVTASNAGGYNNGWNNGYNNGSCQGSCSSGYVQTAYGCLPQGSCGSCRALYNGNQCVNSSVSNNGGWNNNNGWNNGNQFPGGNNGCYINGVQSQNCNWQYYQQTYGPPSYYYYQNQYRYGWNPGYYGNFNLGAYIWINL